jgi:uncharacterized membrane protein YtjA (UPF0391 family)
MGILDAFRAEIRHAPRPKTDAEPAQKRVERDFQIAGADDEFARRQDCKRLGADQKCDDNCYNDNCYNNEMCRYSGRRAKGSNVMLRGFLKALLWLVGLWLCAILFLFASVQAAMYGFGGIAQVLDYVQKILLLIGVIMFIVSLVAGLMRRN